MSRIEIKFNRKKNGGRNCKKNSILKFMSSKTNKIKRIELNMILVKGNEIEKKINFRNYFI